MEIKRFEKDGQKVWSKENSNGSGTTHSACIEVVEMSLNLKTGYEQAEKSMVWLKTSDENRVEPLVAGVMSQLKAGKLKAYRAFSETPFYEGQEQDINPTTEQPLGRYSQVRLCLPEDHTKLHRQFVDNTVVVAETPAVTEPTNAEQA